MDGINIIPLERRIARHNFGHLFHATPLPVLPAAVAGILDELNSDEPDVGRLERIITAEPSISLRVLKTVNSSLYALRAEVMTVRHAITLLGFKRISATVLSYAMLDALPQPETRLFRQEEFWTDNLLRALLAKSIARRTRPGEEEEAFTAALIADVAMPILLQQLENQYGPLVARWREEPVRLAQIERETYQWDHALLGAWILKQWSFPDRLVALVGAHNSSPDEVATLGIHDSVAGCVATACTLPSCMRRDPGRCRDVIERSRLELELPLVDWPGIWAELADNFGAIYAQFNLSGNDAQKTVMTLAEVIQQYGLELCIKPQEDPVADQSGATANHLS